MGWNVKNAIAHLREKKHRHSIQRCAQYTREAIGAGGLNLPRPQSGSAKDFGAALRASGFIPLVHDPGSYQAGDVVIIEGFVIDNHNISHLRRSHPDGHMAMYDGQKWISDFEQPDLYPGNDYRIAKPKYKIYRNSVTP